MKNKNLILTGIILTTWYIPFSYIIGTITIYNTIQDLPPQTILLMTILLCLYTIGLLTINLGLKKILETKKD